ncbi:MAG TPA: hypothetical protein PLS63_02250 [Microthrixaceae bacterium]|nr:hypothetical protein [Microthrixaceae bacterium]
MHLTRSHALSPLTLQTTRWAKVLMPSAVVALLLERPLPTR